MRLVGDQMLKPTSLPSPPSTVTVPVIVFDFGTLKNHFAMERAPTEKEISPHSAPLLVATCSGVPLSVTLSVPKWLYLRKAISRPEANRTVSMRTANFCIAYSPYGFPLHHRQENAYALRHLSVMASRGEGHAAHLHRKLQSGGACLCCSRYCRRYPTARPASRSRPSRPSPAQNAHRALLVRLRMPK